jgi:hypothetical protein
MARLQVINTGELDQLDLKSGVDPFDVIIVKDFLSVELCESVIEDCHNIFRSLPHREIVDNCFYSFDVLPVQSATVRIFRTLNFLSLDSAKASASIRQLFDHMIEFQRRSVLKEVEAISGSRPPRMQIIHYPRGGGFLDWHVHGRDPVNYGLILNLSYRGRQFQAGGTEIEDRNGDIICVEDHSNQGDLILFKFDLKHRVSPCDPDEDLCFDRNGRWTAVLPID